MRSALLKSTLAAVAASAVLWALYFLAVLAVTLARGRPMRGLGVTAWVFGIHGLVFLAMLLLLLLPLSGFAVFQRRGAALSVPAGVLASLVTIVVVSLYWADPGDGDPSTVLGVLASWFSKPLEVLLVYTPFWVAIATFPLVKARLERSWPEC